MVLDPVMGDNGQLYVHSDVIPLYRKLMKYANAITPNQFEAEILADKKITDVKSCLEVLDILHTTGVENVVITSVSLLPSDVAAHAAHWHPHHHHHHKDEETTEPSMYCVCSSKGDQDETKKVFAIGFPTYDGYFTGTGDLFSALLVAWLDEALVEAQPPAKAGSAYGLGSKEMHTPLVRACVKVVATMKAVVLRSYLAQMGITSGGQLDRTQASSAAVIKRCELRLIQSKKDIEQPDEQGVEAVELSWIEKGKH
ncbi:putative pyridoxal kinase [Gamsiella multidivaricata]|nr:putative pyridoxal kinase [Gamsiella multidivaricata]